MQYEHLIQETDGHVSRITLDRPDKLNCLAEQTWDELEHALEAADGDKDVRVIVLSGNGKAFSSGDDISDLDFQDASDARDYARFVMDRAVALERIETPVLAKVDGIAHGGGCELAASADVTIATESSTFRQPEALLNAAPGIALVRYAEMIGISHARELCLTTRKLDAKEAQVVGLVNEVAPADEFEDVVAERVDQLTTISPTSARVIKNAFNSQLGMEEEAVDSLSYLFSMDDMEEGMEAFFGKRDPEWKLQ
ncbi:enoyl-CoA hydratase/isomerase family protein [Halobellus limi]|uniref:Enoyl-CoA hydratase n=1 Tax=Halobellus limi TaxID=699433 RepID=A0A1H6BQQ9_9EURY|nr:enoyl-CoA hydratase/isomerase family protein [Halobellus limi]QCC49371.1 enoyl-CoA hydratase/isomerase family protein [Halobellus limi]SEG63041.1 enoyl-CoA hydratase [Halobellus limi]